MPLGQFDWEGLVQTMSGCTSASSTFLSCAWTSSCPAPALLEGLIPCTYGKCSKWFHSTCCPGANPEFAESSLAEIKSCFQCPECFEEAKKVFAGMCPRLILGLSDLQSCHPSFSGPIIPRDFFQKPERFFGKYHFEVDPIISRDPRSLRHLSELVRNGATGGGCWTLAQFQWLCMTMIAHLRSIVKREHLAEIDVLESKLQSLEFNVSGREVDLPFAVLPDQVTSLGQDIPLCSMCGILALGGAIYRCCESHRICLGCKKKLVRCPLCLKKRRRNNLSLESQTPLPIYFQEPTGPQSFLNEKPVSSTELNANHLISSESFTEQGVFPSASSQMPGANLQSGTEGPHQSEGSSRIPDVIDLTAEDISLPTDPSFGPSIGFQPIESNEEENLSYATIGPFRQIIS